MEFNIIELKDDREIYGINCKSSDRSQAKDIPALSEKYYGTIGRKKGNVIPFFVISSDYNKSAQTFSLFVGGLVTHESLRAFQLPKGLYAQTIILPKISLLCGAAIGKAKRAFYAEWLPQSGYTSLNLEYEHHTELSRGMNLKIEMLFAISKS